MRTLVDHTRWLRTATAIDQIDRADTLALLFLGYPLGILLVSTFSLAIGIPVSAFCFWAPLLIVMALGAITQPLKTGWRHPLVLFVLVLVLALLVSWYLQDFTWDSREYHIPASILIANGWNPLHHPVPPIEKFGIHYYPKGQAIITAATMHAFGYFEAGKFTKYLYLAATLCVVFQLLRREYEFRVTPSAMIAFVVACNTVVVFQLSTNYIDGAIASLYFIEIFAMLGYLRSKRPIYIWLLAITAVLMISLKTSGLFYSFVILGVVAIGHLVKYRFRRWAVPLLLGASVLSGVVFSFNPYVTNTMEKGTPLYPFGTPDAKLLIKRPYFKNMNRFERFFYAYSSAPSVIPGDEQNAMTVWRSPFRPSNWNNYWVPEDLARAIGAFGPFFQLILIPSLALLLFLEWDLLLAVGVVLITLFMHKEGWHARYCPQTFLLPCFIAISLIRSNWRGRGRVIAYVGLAAILTGEIVQYDNGPSVLAQSRSYRALAKQYVSTFGAIDYSFLRQFLPLPVLGTDSQAAPLFLMTEKERAREFGYPIEKSDRNTAAYGNLDKFIKAYQSDTVLIAVRDEATRCLPKSVISRVDGEGGHLAALPYRSSYLAVIHQGRVTVERSSVKHPVTYTTSGVNNDGLAYQVKVSSGGLNAGNYASIQVNGNDFSMNRRGMNVVALVGTVAISRNFDTFTCDRKLGEPSMFAIPRTK